MPRKSTAFEILIASPGDVVSERRILTEVIEDWNSAHAKQTCFQLQARLWEFDAVPAMGSRPQAIINKQLVDEADLLIAVFSTKLGSPTGVSSSGTVEEIERFRSTEKPVFLYFSNAPIPRNHDPEQLRILNKYKHELSSVSLYDEFDNDEGLRRMASRNLATIMSSIVGLNLSPELPMPELDLEKRYFRIKGHGSRGDVSTLQVSPTKPISGTLTMVGLAATLTKYEQLGFLQVPGLTVDPNQVRNLATTVAQERQLGVLSICTAEAAHAGTKILTTTAYISGVTTMIDLYRAI